MNLLKQRKFTENLVSDINEILFKYGIDDEISIDDITVTEKTVSDLVKPESKLSNAIINLLWPSIQSAVVYHYTSMEAAESILSKNIFRLYSIEKNLSDGEIVTFCERFKLNGYLENDEKGTPKYETIIAANTFLGSFTDSEQNLEKDKFLWKKFATKGGTREGARLKIEITASYPDFRKMRYHLKDDISINLLSDIDACIKKHNREFIFNGISKLCSFYLPEECLIQNEYRILYRSLQGSMLQPKNDGDYDFIELPIGTNSKNGYDLKILEVYAEKQLKMDNKYPFVK